MIEISNIELTEAVSITEPVTLAEQKAFMRVDHSDEDDIIEELITAARQDVELETNLALVDSSVSVDIESDDTGTVKLPYVKSIETVTLTDLNDNDAEVDAEDYEVRGNSLRLSVYGRMNASYDIEPEVPTGLKEAIMMLVAYRYNNRGDQEKQTGLPEDIKHKVSKYAQIWL